MNDSYLGPLPQSLVDAARKSKDRLTDLAAYPAEVNKWLAEQVTWLSRPLVGWGESSLGVTCPQKASEPPTRKKLMLGMPWTSEVVYIGRGAKEHGLEPLESVSSGQGCGGGKLQGVVGQVGRLARFVARAVRQDSGVPLRRSGQVPWRHDNRGIRLGSSKA